MELVATALVVIVAAAATTNTLISLFAISLPSFISDESNLAEGVETIVNSYG